VSDQDPSDPSNLTPPPPSGATPAAQPTVPAQQGLPFPMAMGSMMSLQVSNPEAEIIKKVTPEHITRAIETTHEQNMRRLGIHEIEIKHESDEAVREHSRDERDRDDLKRSDARLERMFYVVFGSVGAMAIVLVVKDKTDEALKLVAASVAILLALVGGMGLAIARQNRKRSKPPARED
jgi:hypothetical protein